MIYRVSLKVGYSERWFDFNDRNEAGRFAETILNHDTPYEDHPKRDLYISIRVMRPDDAERQEGE